MDARNDTSWFANFNSLCNALEFVKNERRLDLIWSEYGKGPSIPAISSANELTRLLDRLDSHDKVIWIRGVVQDMSRLLPTGESVHDLLQKLSLTDRLPILQELAKGTRPLNVLLFREPVLFEFKRTSSDTPSKFDQLSQAEREEIESFCASLPSLTPDAVVPNMKWLQFSEKLQMQSYLDSIATRLPELLTNNSILCDFYKTIGQCRGVVSDDVFTMLRTNAGLVKSVVKTSQDFIALRAVSDLKVAADILSDELPALFPSLDQSHELLNRHSLNSIGIRAIPRLSQLINSHLRSFSDVFDLFNWLSQSVSSEESRHTILCDLVETLEPFFMRYVNTAGILIDCLKQMPSVRDYSQVPYSPIHGRRRLIDLLAGANRLSKLPTTAADIKEIDELLAENHYAQLSYYRAIKNALPNILNDAEHCKRLNAQYQLHMTIPPGPSAFRMLSSLFSSSQPVSGGTESRSSISSSMQPKTN